MKPTRLILPFALVAFLLSGCRSSRNVAKYDTTSGATSTYTPVESEETTIPDVKKTAEDAKEKNQKTSKSSKKSSVSRGLTQAEAISAKMDLTLSSGNKRINLGGTYRLKRNDVVQINLTYTMLFTLNVGTLEMTPDYVMLVDRINKRFCRMRYADVPSLAKAGIDFNTLQRVFWGEAVESPTLALQWKYDDWTTVENSEGKFPKHLQFTLNSGKSSYQANFELSNVRASGNWDTRTEVSSKYSEVSLDTVMKALMSVAK